MERVNRKAAALCAAAALALGGVACGAPSSRSAPRPAGPTTTRTTVAAATTTRATTTSPRRSATSAPKPASAPSWPTYDGDAARHGVDASAPAAGAPAVAWQSPPLDGAVYAQPLVADGTVVVATEDDTVYALNRSSGAVVWSRHLGTPVPGRDLPCGDIDPSGITATPVVDTASGTVWVVTFTLPGRHTLWALNLATGAVKASRPADPPSDSPLALQERSALALANGRVYVSYGGLFGDCAGYHGWVLGFPTSGAAPATTFETPTTREAGIWAPPGPAIGSDGSVYVTTGNGTPATSVDDANSVLRLSPGLQVESSFTPTDFAALSDSDRDLGSTSPALLPGGLVFQVGKDGIGYLLDADHLGGVDGQLASVPVCSGGFGGDAVDGYMVVFSCFDSLTAVRVFPRLGGRPALAVAWRASGIRPGPPVIAGGVVWTAERSGALAGYAEATGALRYRSAINTAGSFPTLAAVGADLYVPTGDRVSAFSGA